MQLSQSCTTFGIRTRYTRLLPHVVVGLKVYNSRLCEHIVNIDLSTLISFKYHEWKGR